MFRRRHGAWLASAAFTGLLVGPHSALAQSAPIVSRPVVQGLPSGESQRLSSALARISRDPRDSAALMDAGDAANAMGDPEAAAGFYKRADAINPSDPRIKAGLARALVLQGKPTEAIPLFAAAEAGGATAEVTSDRGLAYDLVGDPTTAQRYYQAALARRDEDEARRRLGISLAITGDAAASDAMLMPLLRKQDKPAWRAHAFALAIAGRTKEAVDTVNAILPGPLAQSVTPYLRYMPRLTRAQQAAAGNLGKFPRASEIGRDDPVIAAYAPAATRVATNDAGLIARGKPLGGGRLPVGGQVSSGTAPLTARDRRARDKAARLARAEAAQAARVAPPEPRPTINRNNDGELPALATSTPMAPAATMAAAPVTNHVATPRPPEPVQRSSVLTASSALAQARPTGAAVAAKPLAPSATTSATPVRVAAASAAPMSRDVPRGTAPGFDLGALGPAAAQRSEGNEARTPSETDTPTAAQLSSQAISLEQAFADLGAPSRAPAPIAGAVDVRAIEPAKPAPPVELAKERPEAEVAQAKSEKLVVGKAATSKAAMRKGAPVRTADAEPEDAPTDKKKAALAKDAKLADAKLADGKKGGAKKGDARKADAKKALPSQPSRIWVQVGVGRDKAAIGHDWRKFAKDNPALFKGRQPYTSDMGRTNRILAGPFETQKAASDLVAKLKKADVAGAFVWTSPDGQPVDPLGAK